MQALTKQPTAATAGWGCTKHLGTMKKTLILLTLAVCMAGQAFAQKLVIGSRIPDLKTVQWLTLAPKAEVPMLIEFYNPDNATSARFFPKLAYIKAKHGNGDSGIQIVVLTQLKGAALDKLAKDYGDAYYIGGDPDGKIYQAFNVQFLPYTILVSSKGELYWQGNLGNITEAVLQKIR